MPKTNYFSSCDTEPEVFVKRNASSNNIRARLLFVDELWVEETEELFYKDVSGLTL